MTPVSDATLENLHATATRIFTGALEACSIESAFDRRIRIDGNTLHRLMPDVEEMLYSALEDFRVDILVGAGPGARTHSLPLPKFTAIGATTRQGLVSAPLRGRSALRQPRDHVRVLADAHHPEHAGDALDRRWVVERGLFAGKDRVLALEPLDDRLLLLGLAAD